MCCVSVMTAFVVDVGVTEVFCGVGCDFPVLASLTFIPDPILIFFLHCYRVYCKPVCV